MLISGQRQLKCWFHIYLQLQGLHATYELNFVDFRSKMVKMLISPWCMMARMLISLRNQQNVTFTLHISSKMLISCSCVKHSTTGKFLSPRNQQNVNFKQHISSTMLISGLNRLKCWFHIDEWRQGCWFHLENSKMLISHNVSAQKKWSRGQERSRNCDITEDK